MFTTTVAIATAALAATPEDSPITVKFNVVTTNTKEVLLSGVALSATRPAVIERRAAHGPERQSLVLDVRLLDDGRLLVRANWTDATVDGEFVK